MLNTSSNKPCKYCGKTTHISFKCFSRPARRKLQRATRPMQKGGKHFKQWTLTRRTWFRNNPPNHEGYYQCYLQISPDCPKYMEKSETTLDHIVSRSRAPELRYVQSNLAPACYPCNTLKGSRDLADFSEIDSSLYDLE